MSEAPGNKVIRLGIETRIKDLYLANDMQQVNHWLDRYPYNKVRATPSAELAREALKKKITTADTTEIPIITPEMLEQHRRDML